MQLLKYISKQDLWGALSGFWVLYDKFYNLNLKY